MTPTLLVLAAGMGSRYGGLKQVDPVGPSGETILDYAVFDALRAGFGRVVFVIRREFEAQFRTQIGASYAGRIAVDYVFQALDALPAGFTPPAGREKPWGTGHAVWCAREALTGPFAVINADDFYGRDSFAQLGRFLVSDAAGAPPSPQPPSPARGPSPAPVQVQVPTVPGLVAGARFAMVGFTLANTLSEHGAVSRGVCAVAADATLQTVVEHTGIERAQVGPEPGRAFSGAEIVSMNCWGLTPALFGPLERLFTTFLATRGHEAKAEFYLPAAVSQLIADGEAQVRVLPTASAWFGVTYRDDKPRVQAALAALVARGEYPAKLF